MFVPYLVPYAGQPLWLLPYYQRPRPLWARNQMVGLPPHVIGGFGSGPAPIEPGYLFFSAGRPIGGLIGTRYRGVSAGVFPFPMGYFGSGGPINGDLLGYAGAPIGFF